MGAFRESFDVRNVSLYSGFGKSIKTFGMHSLSSVVVSLFNDLKYSNMSSREIGIVSFILVKLFIIFQYEFSVYIFYFAGIR